MNHLSWSAIKAHPILAVFLFMWGVEAWWNARYGYQRGDGSLTYAGLLLGIALTGLWLGVKFNSIDDADPRRKWAKKAGVALPIVFCISLSQLTGWAAMGWTLADGGAKRETASKDRARLVSALDRYEAERAKIGVTRAVKAIEAEKAKECVTPTPRNGDGPNCKRLKMELATAERAIALDGLIVETAKELKGVKQVGAAGADNSVLRRFTGLDDAEITFWMTIVLVAAVGIFGTLGPALVGLGLPPAAPPQAGAAPQPQLPPPAGVQRPWSHLDEWPQVPQHAAPPVQQTIIPPANVSGAPINIHFGAAAGGTSAAPEQVVARSPLSPRPKVQPVGATRAEPQRRLRGDRTAAQVPVKRDRINQLCDELMAFKAACLVTSAAGMTPVDDVWHRYQAWAGGGAMAKAAFDTMFGEICGVQRVEFGGAQHWDGVEIAAHQPQAVVGA